ncbi:MAG: flagellar basal body rod protein FlgC [Thermotoga sp.]|nr:MAG: flagellar basal body rod protein FlgC [Thermotoga sp.]HDM70836.1 flagellar basal body rod protein FlgC [Thermotogales bacterium]
MMDIFSIMNISATGMTAQRFRIDVIATNIANAETTRTPEGGPYRRKIPIFAEYVRRYMEGKEIKGVKVAKIVEDDSYRLVYDPDHPDADENGYVKMPNVNVLREMVDLINAQRAYEANVSVFNAVKMMANSALQIGRT